MKTFQTVPLSYWINPAERLVQAALNKWRMRLMKADNTSAIVVLIDPLGPRKLSILRRKREERMREIAERRISNKSVTDILTANESLNKNFPKKVKEKPVIPSVPNKTKPVIVETSKVVKEGESMAPAVNLDDSIQLRNGHIASPVPKVIEHKHSGKSTPVASKNKPTDGATSCDEPAVPTRMSTRHSPQKSPLSQTSVSNSQSTVSNITSKLALQSKASVHSPTSNQGEQKCLQPSKCTLENVKNTVSSKVQSGMKVKDLENMYSSVVQFSKGQLTPKTNLKTKGAKSETNAVVASDPVRSNRKPHATKSLSTRISLRLRRLRQKTQKIRGQGENKGFVKPGVKRKLDSAHASPTPATKKLKQS